MIAKRAYAVSASLLALLIGSAVVADNVETSAHLDAAARKDLIDQVIANLEEGYIYEDVARKLSAALRENRAAGRYAKIDDAREFATRITEDLLSISDDKHLRIFWAEPSPASSSGHDGTQRRVRRPRSRGSAQMRKNYGFVQVAVLDGNVGYLDLRSFAGSDEAVAKADHAMALLADVDALIIDLGRNGGGGPRMVRHLSTYLFPKRTHLVSTFHRGMEAPRERWTFDKVPGKRFNDIPVYVLTSGNTFSAAESFLFGLDIHDRVTIVGERTGGGGHFGDLRPVGGGFTMFLPGGKTYNPETGKGWEAEGIEPDIAVPYAEARQAAHVAFLRHVAADTSDKDRQRMAVWKIQRIEALSSKAGLTKKEMDRLAGEYGDRRFWIEDGRLLYRRRGVGRTPQVVLPASDGTYLLPGMEGFRFRFEPAGGGTPERVVGMYLDGREDAHERSGAAPASSDNG